MSPISEREVLARSIMQRQALHMPCLALITLLMTVQIEWGTFSSHHLRRKY